MPVDAAYDWGGGLIWLYMPPSADAGTSEIRRVIAAIGGGLSLLNEGQLNAPVVGVVIMSVTAGKFSASAYLATPEKAFAATLNSP